MSVNSYSNDQIKTFSILCEGNLQKIRDLRVTDELYYFDEFKITINKKALNNRNDIDKHGRIEIKYGDDSEIKMELINYSDYISRSSFHPHESKVITDYSGIKTEDYFMYFFPETNIIKIYDNTPFSWDLGYEWFQGTYVLSLSSGMMTQETLYSYDVVNLPRRERKIRTKCSDTQEIISYISQEDNETYEPIYADKDPNEMISVASGSGFFINEQGNIITNDHVVEGCQVMKLVYDGNEYEAAVIATDKTNDIALLKTEYKNQNYFKIAKDDVDRSQNIKAIGYGFGKNYSSDIKVTAGIVNSLSGYNDNYSEFQMDAAIQSGNSGGPVINESGDVVGISVAALDSLAVLEDTGTLPQNVNYAIKASTLKQFLNSKETKYFESNNGWFSFSSMSNKEINDLIDNAAVYLSCYMTYAQIEENMTNKVMFNNYD